MKRTLWLTRALAALVLIAALAYWRVFGLLVGAPLSLGGLVVLIYLALSIVSFTGLLLRRVWGFYAFYGLVAFGTIMLSVLFVPVPLGFVPVRERWIVVAAVNAVVLAVAALADYWNRANARGAVHGAA